MLGELLHMQEMIERLEAENADLRKAAEVWRNVADGHKASNARLREALEKIREPNGPEDWAVILDICDTALGRKV